MIDSEAPLVITDLESILIELDTALEGKPGIKPSDAWRYREEVRAKYGLPECGYRWQNPNRYIQEIEAFLQQQGVEVRGKHEFARFFEEIREAQAIVSGPNVFRNPTVVVEDAAENDWFKLRARANQLAHEGVHALQNIKYPSMTDDIAEKEAYYYQMLTPEHIIRYRHQPESIHIWINNVIEKSISKSIRVNEALK